MVRQFPPRNTTTSTMSSTMAFENTFSGRHMPVFAQSTPTPQEEPMTPSTDEVVALMTGTWHLGWNSTSWTPIPSFEQQWALATTSEQRASLLAFHSPTASITLTHYQRSILMHVNLPAKKSDNLDAELTFCDGTLRKRVCDFAYCVEDTSDGAGYWYCDECRNFAIEQEQQEED